MPKPDERANAGKPDTRKRISRLDQLKAQGVRLPPMPPNSAPHITDRLVEIGLTEAAGMSAVPISWLTLAAWQQVTGAALPPWEARLIRRLSSDYLAESRRAEAETCPAPWLGKVTEAQKAAEIALLDAVLG